MGLFRKLGQQVEEFAQATRDAADESADFRCAACGESLHTDHDRCPECGEDAVVPVDSED